MRPRHLTAAALTLLVVACVGSRAPSNPFEGIGGPTSIRIDVQNLNWGDATLHAQTLGTRTRLGVVGGEGRRSYELEWRNAQPLRIQIDLLAGGRCQTREFTLDPGDIVDLTIADGRCRSMASIH